MSIKTCEREAQSVRDALQDLIDEYERECGRLSDAIESAYFEGFEDARSDEDNRVEHCWRASNARKDQLQ